MKHAESILVVDDEPGSRESFRMILRPLYEVRTASSGQEALRSMEKEKIDLVTLDLKMPGLSGLDTLKEIKRCRPDLEVIVITGLSSLSSAREAFRNGASAFVSKPFDVFETMAVIRNSLERRRRESALLFSPSPILPKEQPSAEKQIPSSPV